MRFHLNIRDPKQDAVYRERVAEERRKLREKRDRREARTAPPPERIEPEEPVMGMELGHSPDTYHLLELLIWGMKAIEADLEEGGIFAGHDGENDAREILTWGKEFTAAIQAWQARHAP